MSDESPRARLLAVVLMLAVVAVQVVARYRWGVLAGKEWQLVHILFGWAMCLGIIVVFHGLATLRRMSRATWTLLAVGLVCLTLFWYFGRSDGYRQFFGDPPLDHTTFWPIVPFLYFATMATVLRLILPFSFARMMQGRRPAELGLPWGRTSHSHRGLGWVYLALALFIAPFVIHASGTEVFQKKYPLARDLIDPDGGVWFWHLIVYQAFYFLVFLSGESFWRGYLTFGMERDFGLYALPMAVVPYVTGHFGKPFPETLGAIATGMVLGYLALRHRSVWWGVALHFAVALSMDMLAIAGQGAVIYLDAGTP